MKVSVKKLGLVDSVCTIERNKKNHDTICLSCLVESTFYRRYIGLEIMYDPDSLTVGLSQKITYKINDLPEKNELAYFNQEPLIGENESLIYIAILNDFVYEIKVSGGEYFTQNELDILVKEKIYKDNKKFEQIKKQVEAYEKYESNSEKIIRQPIPEDVKFEVWRRDEGKCVICGSQRNLEFDHIIPLSKGGSSTARNLQLLCEACNRKKSAKI